MADPNAPAPTAELQKKPQIAVAVLCDEVVQAEDGVFSVIRIVNTFFGDFASLGPGQFAETRVHGLISLRNVFGHHTITLKCRNPEGRESHPQRAPVPAPSLSTPEQTTLVNVILDLPVRARRIGRYFLDVYLDEELLTEIPFTIRQQSARETTTGETPR